MCNLDNEKRGTKVVTFGCRLNIYESEVIKDHIKEANLEDTIVVNTCAVTSEAERQAKQAIRRLRRDNPNSKIIVTGCGAQVHSKDFSNMNEVNYVVGNKEKMSFDTYKDIGNKFIGNHERVRVNDIMEVKEVAQHLVSGFSNHTRAFIQIQNGCNHRCTFCIIPYGRGNSRSVPIGEIVKQVKYLVSQGYKEVVLTGVDISSYGEDIVGNPTLGQMVRRLLALVPELPRLRISSIDCIEIDEDLFEVIANEKRLMPHIHLSLQSGDTLILKRMARRHSREDIIELCERLQKCRSDIVFGADIIAGFPTEDETMFKNTLDIIDKCGIVWLHAFSYSERDGTPAARIPKQIPIAVRKERTRRLRELSRKKQKEFFNSQIGHYRIVLVEKNNIGYTEHYAKILLSSDISEGELVKVKVTGFNNNNLLGDIVQKGY